MTICYDAVSSPVGTLWVAAGDAGVRRISLGARDEPDFAESVARRWPMARIRPEPSHPMVAWAVTELNEYFRRARRAFGVPLDLEGLTPFQLRVLSQVAQVPWGSTTTYGAIATALGCGGAARAVGGALSRNPVPLLVPCHRVLAGGDRIGGFTVGRSARATGTKRQLLSLETPEPVRG